MTFANPLPWWALVPIVAAAGAVAWAAYRRYAGARARRWVLTAIRFVTLLAIVIFLMRPVSRALDPESRNVVVPILVDTSRSMAIEDAGHARRIDAARRLVTDRLLPPLGARFHTEVLAFGDGLATRAPEALNAEAHRSDLGAALSAVRERYRGRPVAGIVLLSDGGDTSGMSERAAGAGGPPVYPIGIGATTVGSDREILSVTAAEAVLENSRVELAVSAVSHGRGTDPIELRLLENGRSIEVRRVVPAGEGTPVRATFQVSPQGGAATVYTVETPAAAGELVPENNSRSVLVVGPPRPRRILLVEGAPGFEHSFLKRTWMGDRGLEVDSVVRKGQNEQGSDTYYIQAARSRGDSLASGYPAKVEQLFAYDAIVLANVEADQLTRAQLEATRDFVARRGGGLLVLGARSFLRQGLLDSSLEDALPLDLNDRAGVVPASAPPRAMNRVALTVEGETHPIMQLGASPVETRKRWDGTPPLASIVSIGGPRPGAVVLATTSGPGGTPRALIAVQRFGEGRSMVFTGEAAWRWRMMMPATDRSYDTFWRQAIRWLSVPAADPIAMTVPAGATPGEQMAIRVAARDAAFQPFADASVDLRVTAPDGRTEQLRAAPEQDADNDGRFVGRFRPEQTGVYRVVADVRRSGADAGTATASLLVGGADLEMTDPRLNLQLLQRLALATGGRVVTEGQLGSLADSLTAGIPAAAASVRRDLWHNGWSFALILTLLASEWVLRRRWGMR